LQGEEKTKTKMEHFSRIFPDLLTAGFLNAMIFKVEMPS
jgi:hypothetical protein